MRSRYPYVRNYPAPTTTPPGSARCAFRGRLRRLLVAAAAGALLAGAGVTAAQADTTATYNIGPGNLDETVAPGSVGKTVNFSIKATASAPTTFTAVTVSYDLSALAGIATLTPQSGTCNTEGTVVICKVAKIDVGTSITPTGTDFFEGSEVLPLLVVPVAGATAGESASVPVTVTSASPAATGSSSDSLTFTLADGPNLVLSGYGENKTVDVAQNAEYSRPVTFTNAGDVAAQGVTVTAGIPEYGLSIPELHSNCQYTSGVQEDVACYFPDLVEPGATETVSPVIKVLTTSDLMLQAVRFSVFPGYEGIQGNSFTYGTGAALTLKDSTGAAQVPVSGQTQQSDIAQDNALEINLAVPTNSASLSADGSVNSTASGTDDVQGFITNSGDGYAELFNSDDFQFTADIVFPSGVTVTSVSDEWTPVVNGVLQTQETGRPGFSEYIVASGTGVPDGGTAGIGGNFSDRGWSRVEAGPPAD
ncbi:MAG TPA: hypothetical protein VGM10_31055 [Actinocrinis sp.]|jgi:hypothetical protein